MSDQSNSPTSAAEARYEQLIEQIAEMLEAGEPVDLDSHIAQHPQHADRLRRAVPAMQAMFDLGRDRTGGTRTTRT